MKKYKLLSVFLVFVLSLGLFACKKEETIYRTSSEGAFAYENATVYFGHDRPVPRWRGKEQ